MYEINFEKSRVKSIWQYTGNFYPIKLWGLGITGSLQEKPALSMEKGCKNHKETNICCG